MRRAALFLLALPLAGCVPAEEREQPQSPQDLPALAGNRGNPQLALADHVLAGYFAAQTGAGPTVCLATSDGRDAVALAPQDERALMMRHVRLSPMSTCVERDRAWVNADSGDAALVFTLQPLSCADADHCTAFVGYGAGSQDALPIRYALAWEGDGWAITRHPAGGAGQ